MRQPPPWEGEFIAFFHARRAAYVRVGYALLGSWPAAEDATQEAFSRMYAKWPSIKGDTPDPYGRKVLVNVCLSMLRARQRESVREQLPELSIPGDPMVRVDLMDALARLRPRDRAVVALRYLEDLPVTEVALVLDLPEGTVKSQCSRALDKLRDLLPDHHGNPPPHERPGVTKARRPV